MEDSYGNEKRESEIFFCSVGVDESEEQICRIQSDEEKQKRLNHSPFPFFLLNSFPYKHSSLFH